MKAFRIAGAILMVGGLLVMRQENGAFFALASLTFFLLGLWLLLIPEMIVGLFNGKKR